MTNDGKGDNRKEQIHACKWKEQGDAPRQSVAEIGAQFTTKAREG